MTNREQSRSSGGSKEAKQDSFFKCCQEDKEKTMNCVWRKPEYKCYRSIRRKLAEITVAQAPVYLQPFSVMVALSIEPIRIVS